MNFVALDLPKDFHPTLKAVGCYFEYKDKILLLKRHPDQSEGNTWSLPAGKIEKGEAPRATAVRETYEELGIRINESDLEPMDKLYVRRSPIDYIFYRFRKEFLTQPTINLDLKENVEARWVTIQEGLELPLIYAGKEALQTYQNLIEKRT